MVSTSHHALRLANFPVAAASSAYSRSVAQSGAACGSLELLQEHKKALLEDILVWSLLEKTLFFFNIQITGKI